MHTSTVPARSRGETNRCASTVPSDAGHATDYAPSSQLPDLQVAYPAHRVSLPTRTASRVEIGKGEWDAQTRRAIKDQKLPLIGKTIAGASK